MHKHADDNSFPDTSGSILTRNIVINVTSQGIPIVVAVFTIPLLIRMLGTERFGALTLTWIVMVYFSLFDLGLGRATTKFVAEHYTRNTIDAIPTLVWSSVAIHALLGLLGGSVLAIFTPTSQGIS